jgi:hypothetical protein
MSFSDGPRFLVELNLEMLIFAKGGKPENPEKNPRGKGENQQQTQLTYDTEPWNQSKSRYY